MDINVHFNLWFVDSDFIIPPKIFNISVDFIVILCSLLTLILY